MTAVRGNGPGPRIAARLRTRALRTLLDSERRRPLTVTYHDAPPSPWPRSGFGR